MSGLSDGWDTDLQDENWDQASYENQVDLYNDAAPKDDMLDHPERYQRQYKRASVALAERPEPTFQWDKDACNYHRNSAGHWVVIGPVELVTMGTVGVRTKAGKERTEEVLGLGEPFDFRGMQYRYGYIAQRSSKMHHRPNKQGSSYRSQEDAAKSYARQYGR